MTFGKRSLMTTEVLKISEQPAHIVGSLVRLDFEHRDVTITVKKEETFLKPKDKLLWTWEIGGTSAHGGLYSTYANAFDDARDWIDKEVLR